jgi:hypothetical protein
MLRKTFRKNLPVQSKQVNEETHPCEALAQFGDVAESGDLPTRLLEAQSFFAINSRGLLSYGD